MKSLAEIKAQIATTQCGLNKRIDALDEKVQAMTARYTKEVNAAKLFASFVAEDKITCYSWSHEYSFLPGRECFVSLKSIKPMSKAYKGTQAKYKDTHADGPRHGFSYPDTIRLSAEEFTIRRLKGQI